MKLGSVDLEDDACWNVRRERTFLLAGPGPPGLDKPPEHWGGGRRSSSLHSSSSSFRIHSHFCCISSLCCYSHSTGKRPKYLFVSPPILFGEKLAHFFPACWRDRMAAPIHGCFGAPWTRPRGHTVLSQKRKDLEARVDTHFVLHYLSKDKSAYDCTCVAFLEVGV